MNPKVLIGITTYNHQSFILPCLESVLGQTYKNLKVFVADDKSRDQTCDVVEDFIKNHPDLDITFIKNDPNLGISNNVNQLIKKITDEKYAVMFSGDDIMEPQKVELQVRALEENPDATFCFSDMEWFLSSTGKKIVNHYGLINRPTTKIEDLLTDNSIPSPTIMFRTAPMKGVFYDPKLKYINDHLFEIELLARGRAIFINQSLVRYRKHSNASSIVQTYLEDRLYLFSVIKNRFSKSYPKSVKKYEKLIFYSYCLENQRAGNYKIALKYLLKTLPTSAFSIKWLGRMANMLWGFIKLFKA